MHTHRHIHTGLLVAGALTAACAMSLLGTPVPPSESPLTPAPSATAAPPAAHTASPAPADVSATATMAPTAEEAFCDDQQPRQLIAQFESALRTSNGDLLASLVSPQHGMDARLFRDGRVVNYDREHAAALFESTFALNWGLAPGSGLETVGSFHDLVVPDLLDVLTRDYELVCNTVRVGGTTYVAAWPYAGINFYSLHFPGTHANGNLDWHTWLIGMHFVNEKPYLYAIMQFKWEP